MGTNESRDRNQRFMSHIKDTCCSVCCSVGVDESCDRDLGLTAHIRNLLQSCVDVDESFKEISRIGGRKATEMFDRRDT